MRLAKDGLPYESDFQGELWRKLCAPKRPLRLNRTNSGRALIRDDAGEVQGAYRGAANGTGDLSGLARPDGLHVEVEVKVRPAKGKTKKAQANRERMVNGFGGVYVRVWWQKDLGMADNVARGVELVDAAIAARRQGRAREYMRSHELMHAELQAENELLHGAIALQGVSIGDLFEDDHGIA